MHPIFRTWLFVAFDIVYPACFNARSYDQCVPPTIEVSMPNTYRMHSVWALDRRSERIFAPLRYFVAGNLSCIPSLRVKPCETRVIHETNAFLKWALFYHRSRSILSVYSCTTSVILIPYRRSWALDCRSERIFIFFAPFRRRLSLLHSIAASEAMWNPG